MPLTQTLAKVEADIAAGRLPLARQRLRGLVSSFPQDLSLRSRLAEIYRLYGERAEAGRWAYLDEQRDLKETAAFEERYAAPLRRMKALAWRGPEALAATAFAAEQLAEVRAGAAEALGRAVDWDDSRLLAGHAEDEESDRVDKLFGIGCALAALCLFAIWAFGAYSLLRLLPWP